MIETIYSNPNELYHHGVKGMKWGVRKDPEYSSNFASRRLAKKLSRQVDSQAELMRNTYRGPAGNLITVGDKKAHNKNVNSYLNYKSKVANKYDIKKSNAIIGTNGKASVEVILERNGKTYVTSLEKSYDPFYEKRLTYAKE